MRGLARDAKHAVRTLLKSPGFTIAVAANPGVPDIDQEVRRFAFHSSNDFIFTI